MVWPKLTVSNYPEMLRKLSFSAFIVTIACVTALRRQIGAIDILFQHFDFAPPIELIKSVTVPFGTVLVALAVAFISESIRLHDKISDLLRIRAVFDVRWILIPMALLSGATVNRAQFGRIDSQRRDLMGQVFYEYASSAQKCEIDKHLVIQALTAWSWYWLCIETIAIVLPTTMVLAWFGHWPAVTIALVLVLALLVLMVIFRIDANRYAEAEVHEILSDQARQQAVRATFNAL